MKCIRCQFDSTYPQRTKRICPQCKGLFAFEPREGDKLSDMAFQRAIEAVSAEGRVRWGVEHLYYEICRRKRLTPGWEAAFWVVAAMVAVFAVLMAINADRNALFGLIPAGLFCLAALYVRTSSPFVRFDRETFRQMYRLWELAHGAPDKVIARLDKPKAPKQVEPDVADYSFDRAVICDRARTVDLLLANNFHFENNCAVLSVEGYPPGPFATVQSMLKRNPRLQVFALHDATPAGCQLAHRLATDPAWFAGKVNVIDVGLRPIHGSRFRGLLLHSKTAEVSPSPGITAWEAAWLAKHALELAAIRPEQVLKRLFKAINTPIENVPPIDGIIYLPPREPVAATASGDVGGGGDGGGVLMGGDAGDADGPADSFG